MSWTSTWDQALSQRLRGDDQAVVDADAANDHDADDDEQNDQGSHECLLLPWTIPQIQHTGLSILYYRREKISKQEFALTCADF